MGADGVVKQLNDWRWLTFGELDGAMSPRVQAFAALAGRAEGIVATAVPDILQRMWEKLTHLGTSAVGTVLLRANTGEIARSSGGVAFMHRVLERNAAIAAANGHPMPDSFMAEFRALVRRHQGRLRDVDAARPEAGGRIEADHILGFLLDRPAAAGVPHELHEAAYLHAKAYEQRRDAGRLPEAGLAGHPVERQQQLHRQIPPAPSGSWRCRRAGRRSASPAGGRNRDRRRRHRRAALPRPSAGSRPGPSAVQSIDTVPPSLRQCAVFRRIRRQLVQRKRDRRRARSGRAAGRPAQAKPFRQPVAAAERLQQGAQQRPTVVPGSPSPSPAIAGRTRSCDRASAPMRPSSASRISPASPRRGR